MSSLVLDRESLRQVVEPLCQDVPVDVLQDFVSRMDPEYFRRFDPATIARHIHLAATLTPDHPCELAVTQPRHEHFELTIVAYDYFAEFATIYRRAYALGLKGCTVYRPNAVTGAILSAAPTAERNISVGVMPSPRQSARSR